jgi:hypothetical protein
MKNTFTEYEQIRLKKINITPAEDVRIASQVRKVIRRDERNAAKLAAK